MALQRTLLVLGLGARLAAVCGVQKTVHKCDCLPRSLDQVAGITFTGCGWPEYGWCDVAFGCKHANDIDKDRAYGGWDRCEPPANLLETNLNMDRPPSGKRVPPSVAAQIKGALGRDTIKSGVKARLKIARARLDLIGALSGAVRPPSIPNPGKRTPSTLDRLKATLKDLEIEPKRRRRFHDAFTMGVEAKAGARTKQRVAADADADVKPAAPTEASAVPSDILSQMRNRIPTSAKVEIASAGTGLEKAGAFAVCENKFDSQYGDNYCTIREHHCTHPKFWPMCMLTCKKCSPPGGGGAELGGLAWDEPPAVGQASQDDAKVVKKKDPVGKVVRALARAERIAREAKAAAKAAAMEARAAAVEVAAAQRALDESERMRASGARGRAEIWDDEDEMDMMDLAAAYGVGPGGGKKRACIGCEKEGL